MKGPILFSFAILIAIIFASMTIYVIANDNLKGMENLTKVGEVRVFTTEHDGHKWILATKSNAVSILHHPDCECQE